MHQLFLEIIHHLAAPAGHCTVINAKGRVGNHQILVNAHNLAKAAANRTGSKRAVVTEQIFVWTVKADAVRLEQIGEMTQLWRNAAPDMAASSGKGRLQGIQAAGGEIIVVGIADPNPVNQQCKRCRISRVSLV